MSQTRKIAGDDGRFEIHVVRPALGLKAYIVLDHGVKVFPKQQGKQETFMACQIYIEQHTGRALSGVRPA